MGIWFVLRNLKNLYSITGNNRIDDKEKNYYYIKPEHSSNTICQQLIEKERGDILERRKEVFNNPSLKQEDVGNNLVGLCLSGGGIRSATFNLGLIQAFFRKKLLKRVDYLSTVSGGGYIGACLTSLLNSTPPTKNEQGNDKYDYVWKKETSHLSNQAAAEIKLLLNG